MATSGYTDVAVTAYDTLRFNWSRSGVSIAENKSDVSWNLQLISSNYGAISSSASRAWSVNVNGSAYSGTANVSIGNNTSKILASGSTAIPHNADGTKSFAFSFSQVFNINFNGWVGTISGSGSAALDTIPRTSSVSSNSANIGSAITISISRASDSFTHTLRYGFGGLGGTIVDKTSNTSCSWTVPDSFYTQIPNAKSGRGTIWCDTYSGSTLIGTSSCIFDVGTTESVCKPTLSPTAVDQETAAVALTGNSNVLIKNYNKVQVAFNVVGQKSASISSVNVTCGSKNLDKDGVLNNVDSGTFVFTVRDSRGYSASSTVTKTLVDYTPLTCNLNADSDLLEGTAAKITLNISGNFFAGSFGKVTNSLSVQYRYKVNDGAYPTDDSGNDVWTSLTNGPTKTDGKYTAQEILTGLDYHNTYTIQVRAKDAIYNTTTEPAKTAEYVVKIVPTFDWSDKDFNFNVPVHSKGGITEDIKVVDNGDCNDMRTSGRYYMSTTSTNKPGDQNGWLTVQSYGANYCYQEYVTSTGIKYYRMQDENGWGAWILTDGGVYSKTVQTQPWAAVNSNNAEIRVYHRIGNMVSMLYNSYYQAGTNSFQLVEQPIPLGFRPVGMVVVTYAQVVAGTTVGYGRFDHNSADNTDWAVLTSLAFTEHRFTTSWITNDPFPTE